MVCTFLYETESYINYSEQKYEDLDLKHLIKM